MGRTGKFNRKERKEHKGKKAFFDRRWARMNADWGTTTSNMEVFLLHLPEAKSNYEYSRFQRP
jgi:hypothetical protein